MSKLVVEGQLTRVWRSTPSEFDHHVMLEMKGVKTVTPDRIPNGSLVRVTVELVSMPVPPDLGDNSLERSLSHAVDKRMSGKSMFGKPGEWLNREQLEEDFPDEPVIEGPH